jgi:hypothetical protein
MDNHNYDFAYCMDCGEEIEGEWVCDADNRWFEMPDECPACGASTLHPELLDIEPNEDFAAGT